MNAPAKIRPARAKYAPIVTHHMPLCDGEELELRCSLLQMRDNATSKLRRCSDDAAGILHEIQRLATTYAYAAMPTEELKDLRYRLLQLTQTASGIEMFAHRIAYPGGTDARG